MTELKRYQDYKRQSLDPGKIAERYYRSQTEKGLGGWGTEGSILTFNHHGTELTYEVKRGDTMEDIDRVFEALRTEILELETV